MFFLELFAKQYFFGKYIANMQAVSNFQGENVKMYIIHMTVFTNSLQNCIRIYLFLNLVLVTS
jgi:hypothetical protein